MGENKTQRPDAEGARTKKWEGVVVFSLSGTSCFKKLSFLVTASGTFRLQLTPRPTPRKGENRFFSKKVLFPRTERLRP